MALGIPPQGLESVQRLMPAAPAPYIRDIAAGYLRAVREDVHARLESGQPSAAVFPGEAVQRADLSALDRVLKLLERYGR
jgi:hypothetical protein